MHLHGDPPDTGYHSRGLSWKEYDFANPVSYYSKTKYAADLALADMPNVAIVRLRMPMDSVPGPRNTITKLASYRKVIDVTNSITVVDDLMKVIAGIIEKRATGIFHAVNPGPVSHREILSLYRENVDPTHSCEFISDDELVASGLAAKPRSNCILSSKRLADLGLHMRPAKEALRDAMIVYGRFRVSNEVG